MTIDDSNKFIQELRNKKIFILAALEQETENIEGIIHTGLGKINAAIKTTETILKYKPRLIINYGTCGSINKSLSGLISCTKFIQHDIDCSPLGFKKGLTPFDDVNDIEFSENGYICASGDLFVTDSSEITADVVDMEAYSIAKACNSMNVDFKCYKYITDSADGSASLEWVENCSNGINLFIEEIIRNNPS